MQVEVSAKWTNKELKKILKSRFDDKLSGVVLIIPWLAAVNSDCTKLLYPT